MPNSRIEAAFRLTTDVIEALGAWTTDGNNLGAGGGDLLGSLDNYPFYFITNGIKRGGFQNTGEFFLTTNNLNPESNHRFKTFRLQTNDDIETVAFSFSLADKTTYFMNAEVVYQASGSAAYGALERKICYNRNGTSTINKEHSTYTDRVGNLTTNMRWRLTGNTAELVVKGIAATNLIWSGMIRTQGSFIL